MANRKIGNSPTDRRTVSLEKCDWDELNQVVIDLKLNSASSAIRAFLRLYKSHHAVVMPLLKLLVEINDRIQPEAASKTLKKAKFNIKDVIIGATSNGKNNGNSG